MDFNSPRPTIRKMAHRTCGGTGFRKGYEHVWDGGCFGCSATGQVATPASVKAVKEWEAIQDAVLVIPIETLRPGMALDGADSDVVEVALRRSRRIDSEERPHFRLRYFVRLANGDVRRVRVGQAVRLRKGEATR